MLAELTEGAKRNPIWFGAVATITGVQGFFAWEFWGAISADPAHQLALRALGVSFVAGEVVALDMASRADLNQEHKRATGLRALWCVLALSTFTADINALSGVLREGDAPRIQAAAAFDANQARITDLETRIDRADDPFDNELLSVTAYDAAINGKEGELATARASRARMWRILELQRQLTELQTARAAAVEVATWQTELEQERRAPATHAPRPETGAVEFAPFADMLTSAGRKVQEVTGQPQTASVQPEDVRAGMAWVATIAMKLMLTFGVWVGLQRGRGSQSPSARANKQVEAPEATDRAALTFMPEAQPAPKLPAAKRNAATTTFSRRQKHFRR
ncbi:MAG: hypothetical protein J0L81_02295 [Caulobacterales bacterium]|nr:hypothetical protein [Caulobacterales bacterium]